MTCGAYIYGARVSEVGRRRAGAAERGLRSERSRHEVTLLSLSVCVCVCVCVVNCELNFFKKASRIGEYASSLSMADYTVKLTPYT